MVAPFGKREHVYLNNAVAVVVLDVGGQDERQGIALVEGKIQGAVSGVCNGELDAVKTPDDL